jgi:hypothetical protein
MDLAVRLHRHKALVLALLAVAAALAAVLTEIRVASGT